MNNHRILCQLEKINETLEEINLKISNTNKNVQDIAQLAGFICGIMIAPTICKIFSWLFYFD